MFSISVIIGFVSDDEYRRRNLRYQIKSEKSDLVLNEIQTRNKIIDNEYQFYKSFYYTIKNIKRRSKVIKVKH